MRFDGVGNLIQPLDEVFERRLQPRIAIPQFDHFTRQPASVVGPVLCPSAYLFGGQAHAHCGLLLLCR
jgi:hypothetical protein